MQGQQADNWEEAVGDLYDAVLEREHQSLHRAVQRFETLIDSDGCHLFATNDQEQELFTVWTGEFANMATLAKPYYLHYMHIDPRRTHVLSSPGRALRCSQVFNDRYVDRSEFYQDFLIPMGARFVAGGALRTGPNTSSVVAFNRTLGREDFSEADTRLIARYFPHLQRAVRMALEPSTQALVHGTTADILQQDVGVLGVDRAGRVLFINPAARHRLSEARHAGLRGARLLPDGPLGQAYAATQRLRQPQALRLHHPKGLLVVTVWPAPQRNMHSWLPAVSDASDHALHCCMLVQLVQPGRRLTHRLLIQLFGLTAAEARLAKELVQGLSVEAYAHKFSVSVATVRTQLRQILAKTGYARQQDLLRNLAALQLPQPAPASETPPPCKP